MTLMFMVGDTLLFIRATRNRKSKPRNTSPLHSLQQYVTLHVVNNFDDVATLHSHLNDINLLDANRLRPSWDSYFMTLASLASMRSNCMKRRVGAILVRNKRILATGYNGTPLGLTNCNEGGCSRCNGSDECESCLCLHAEENALLETGRERVEGATLYCNYMSMSYLHREDCANRCQGGGVQP
ncbi:cytidine deaminase-like protein [Lactarius akahatsu]|uniref:dCMP deaminase n=1 Tax=Lactarius akahatsu TaxID=416441 RepID=A0AAD4QDR8_9AGAM|nr:cytidine deaminase-like protein [Lactarius akahatsu]